MTRSCSICGHADSEAINKALIEGRPHRGIAKQFRTSEAAMYRHKQNHLPQALLQSKKVQEVVQSDRLMDRLLQLNVSTLAILRGAEAADDHRLALQAVGRAAKLLELEARLLGELDESTKIAFGVNVQGPQNELYDMTRLDMAELEALERLLEKASKEPSVPRVSAKTRKLKDR